MSFTYALNSEGWVCLTGEGIVSMLDRADCVRRLLADSSLPTPSNVFIDVTAVSNSPSMDDVPNIQFMIRLLRAKFQGKVAILNTVVGHTFMSYVVAFDVDNICRAVRTVQEARDWFAE